MATLEQIGAALKKAAAAGDTAAATKLASAYKAMQGQGSQAPSVNMSVTDAFARKVKTPPPVPSVTDFASQGLSGLNEGIAMGLGAPVDIATLVLNAGSAGINKLTGTDIPQIRSPVGGSDTFRTMLAPTIKEESDDPALRGTRRVMQEVGAWAVPAGGVASKVAKPAKTLLKEAPAVLASGGGAAVAEQLAPDNPLAEFAGQALGSMTPSAAGRLAKRGPKLGSGNVDELRDAKTAAYKEVDNLGVSYTPQAYDNALIKMATELKDAKINPNRHEAAYSVMQDLVAQRGRPMTLTELDQWRQIIRRDLITPSYTNDKLKADAEFGQMMLDQIDDFIGSAAAKDMASGDPLKAAGAITKARELNTRYRKAETLADALYKAKLQTDATGSGGNINNAIRQQIKAILTNPKRSKAFTKGEIMAMESLVKGGKIENLLRLVGKLSPSGNGLMAALGIGGTALNPALAAAPLAGMAAKSVADKATIGKAATLQQMVANGAPPPRMPMPLPSPSLVYAQGANQLERKPIEITIGGLGGAR
jgi:hypothetical protein